MRNTATGMMRKSTSYHGTKSIHVLLLWTVVSKITENIVSIALRGREPHVVGLSSGSAIAT